MLCAVVGGKLRLPAHRLHDGGMAIAEDHRTPGEAVVYILIPVDILQACTAAVTEVERHGRLGAEGAANAPGERSPGPFQVLMRSAPVHLIFLSGRQPLRALSSSAGTGSRARSECEGGP